jgi:dihydroflavonol-4-reductase
MRSVLITGADGFIGSHICDAFFAEGYNVYGLVHRTSDLRFLKNSQVNLIYGDLAESEGILAYDSDDNSIIQFRSIVDWHTQERSELLAANNQDGKL